MKLKNGGQEEKKNKEKEKDDTRIKRNKKIWKAGWHREGREQVKEKIDIKEWRTRRKEKKKRDDIRE